MTSSLSTAVTEMGFDPDALREKYREERDKRLRADGNDQYIAMDGEFSRYLDDPSAAGITREPLTDEVDVAIIGTGFSGLLAGARLRRYGVESIRMIESGAELGGTWYWNQYPGVQCDIESYIYLPLLEEMGYMPKEKYSYGPEILEHCKALGRYFDLYRDVCFGTRVHEMHWDDADNRWVLHTNHQDRMRARFVVMAIGPLSRPKLPGIPGVATFEGHSFHTSRWDYDYTGGDTNGNLTKLSDKVVGVIGTGATAVQCIPHVGEAAQHMYVFRRTPSSIDVRGNRPTDPEWAMSLEPGWQQHRIENFGNIVAGSAQEEDLVSDGWTDILRNLTALGEGARLGTPEEIAEAMELADLQKMEQIRSRVNELVKDPDIAEALKPYYRQFCKRPCFHDDYLPTFNRPNVTLVDTGGQGVERITPPGCDGGRRGVRVGLPDLRHRVRGGHRLLPSGRLRDLRPGRGDAERAVERRHVHLPRGGHPGIPQPVAHGRYPVGGFPQLHRAVQRAEPARGLHHRARPVGGSGGRRAHRAGRGRLGADHLGVGLSPGWLLGVLHPRLLQQRGKARRRPWLVRRHLRRRCPGVLQTAEGMARPGHPARP